MRMGRMTIRPYIGLMMRLSELTSYEYQTQFGNQFGGFHLQCIYAEVYDLRPQDIDREFACQARNKVVNGLAQSCHS